MASAVSLSPEEIRLIKAMLRLRPRLTNQAILAYFTRPGRDINHRVIAEIAGGRWSNLPPASEDAARIFMRAADGLRLPDAEIFVREADPVGRRAPLQPPVRLLHLDWWPVGQGLFASGAVEGFSEVPLTWVFDCGTSSRDTLLTHALDNYESSHRALGAASISLAALSHFDADHISGFVRLIGRFPVRKILLPYIPLWQRLVVALEQGIGADDELFGFFLDPAEFVAATAREVGQIVFVPPAGPDDLAVGEADGPGGESPGPWEGNLKIEDGDPPEGADGDPVLTHSRGPQVQFLRRGGRILAPLLWEFVPYNDAQFATRATPAFLAAALPLVDQIRSDESRRADALHELKRVYDRHFGATAEARNLISLFLYSGALGRHLVLRALDASHRVGLSGRTLRFSQMHTGDGTLDSGRYVAFERFFSPGRRLQRARIFQVMHHGAKANWHIGLAAKLRPAASIFSSDPAHRRLRHPHGDVLRDFWPFHPCQVDRTDGFHFLGLLARR